ncbi:MAG: hypothetical protein WDW38_009157 [Sanguina aurantia]
MLAASSTLAACTNTSSETQDPQPDSPPVLDPELIAAWGGLPPPACLTSDPDVIVTWDPSTKRCVPDVCDGALLTDIRGLDGRASVRNLCAGPLFDHERTATCLEGQSFLFLGDSTIQETVQDIAALLANIGREHDTFFKFITDMKSYLKKKGPKAYKLPQGVYLQMHGARVTGRDFTVRHDALKTSLRFRFMGHPDPRYNNDGIVTFLHPSILSEFMCQFATEPPTELRCRPLDALVLNSGQHDVLTKKAPSHLITRWFTMHLDLLLTLVAPHHAAATAAATGAPPAQAIAATAGTAAGTERPVRNALLAELDSVSRQRVSALGIPFLDTAAVMISTPNWPACCSVSGVHSGSHEHGDFVKAYNRSNDFTASSLVTNMQLRSLCPVRRA